MTTRPILKLNLTTPPEDLEQLHFLTKNAKPNSTLDTSTNHIAIHRKDESKSITTKATTKTNKTLSTHNIVVDQQALIAEKIEKRRLEFNEILKFLQTNYPNCFNKKRKLIAIGIHKELLKLHSDILSKAKLSRLFAKYCRSTRYKNRLVVGAIRLNLDGSDSAQVTESEIAHLKNHYIHNNKQRKNNYS